MDSTLVAVTLISMSMAVALSVIVWRMLREERRRSAARVIALSHLAADAGSGLQIARDGGQVSRSREMGVRSPRQPSVDLPLNRQAQPPTPNLFSQPSDARSPWGGRLAVMACVALAATAVVLFALSSQQRHATASRQTTAAQAPAAAPLELLSLHDSRDATSLTVTGLVQNPSTGAPLSQVAVTAFALDEKGDFLASGRAMLEVTPLTPGEQSPFSVSVPITGNVARYRIGFRADDGRVIAHVDERGSGDRGPGTGGSTFDE
jgi:type II secretory pathway pseudopilin PulG